MFLIILALAIPVFLLVSINIFKMFPRWLKNFCAYFTPIGFLLNLAISSMILLFTGAAMIVGTSNLTASVFFGLYLIMYRKVHRIEGVDWHWKGPLGLKLIPIPEFREKNKTPEGIKKIIF